MDTNALRIKSLTRGDNRGIAIVYVALILVVLLAFAGLAIDIGYMYMTKTQLQNAADAAALAGAELLNGSNSTSQNAARVAAQTFAAHNSVAKQSVIIDLNSTNDANGDIVIGYWNGTDVVTPTGSQKANALKVTCRRTAETGTGIATTTKVPLTISRAFHWNEMGAKASAVAWRPIRPTVPITLCINACNLPTPIRMYFKQDKKYGDPDNNKKSPPPPQQTLGWTEFSFTSQATSLGPNSLTAKYIHGEVIPPDVCGKDIYTNNGVGEVVIELKNEFNKQTSITGLPYWEVVVPVLNSATFSACPPGDQPLPYTVERYAILRITEVEKSPDPSIYLTSITCIPCGTNLALGEKAYLIK